MNLMWQKGLFMEKIFREMALIPLLECKEWKGFIMMNLIRKEVRE